jgi:NADPH-dependent glutamate synthase beta subunit-like oxidoreductase
MKMTADETNNARLALNNASSALASDKPWVAVAWADTASDVIREARLSGVEERAIVAPRDGPTLGDKAVVVCVLFVAVWFLADWIGGLL